MNRVAAHKRLTDADVERFWADGYLVVESALSRDEANRFAELIRDLMPRSLDVPDHWQSADGRIKPFATPGNQTFDSPPFIELYQNAALYDVAAQLLDSPRLRVRDGSLAITLRNDSPHPTALSQALHLDPAVPGDVAEFQFTLNEVEVGGCYYFTDVEPRGGGLHLVPGGHRTVEEHARAAVDGRQLFNRWRDFAHLFPETVEVTGMAGDFVMTHHLMPHAASHNRQSRTRIAQFLRFFREDQPYVLGERPGDLPVGHSYNDLQIAAMSTLGRKLLGVDPW